MGNQCACDNDRERMMQDEPIGANTSKLRGPRNQSVEDKNQFEMDYNNAISLQNSNIIERQKDTDLDFNIVKQ